MAKRADITPELCRQLLRYEPETGNFYWRRRPPQLFKASSMKCHRVAWNRRFAGKPAFQQTGKRGYKMSPVCGFMMTGHRVAWAIHYGMWPTGEIDHINGDKTDNRICNLRDVPRATNAKNCGIGTRNTSGVVGVYWDGKRQKWIAHITSAKRKTHLGEFREMADAIAARHRAERARGYIGQERRHAALPRSTQ